MNDEQRILLRMATAKDTAMTADVLARARLEVLPCADMTGLVRAFEGGAAAMVVCEEALVDADLPLLTDALAGQPTWSDLPILVLGRHGAASAALRRAVHGLPNHTVLEKPIRVATLVSAVSSMLRARQRQYQVRDLFEDLRRTDQRRSEFLATLAHELRNPLAPIRTSLALLSSGRLDAAAEARLHRITTRQVDHMVRLVDDLLEVSRVSRGKVQIEGLPVRLGSVVGEAVELCRPMIAAAGHKLTIDVEGPGPLVRGDAVRLVQVFSNLLNNAAKYTPPHGQLGIRVRESEGMAVVEVRDNGIGLSTGMLDAIFDIFVQEDDGAKLAQGGLGIGLTLVRSLIELHGGSVTASSEGRGHGALFTVRLPLLSTGSAGHDAGPPHPSASKAQLELNVLLVDDNRDAADSLGMLLEAAGARTTVAYSGAQALELSQGQSIDVAILDIGMPEMDGCQLAQRLRERPDASRLTLIALTGWGQERDRQRLATAGFQHHLLKPVKIEELIRLLQGVPSEIAPRG